MITGAALAENPAALLCDRLLERLSPDDDLRGQVVAVRHALDGPLRVALTGRVSSGKSTLLNALVGRRIAATAAEECTRYPTVFAHGAPEAAVGVTSDGQRVPLSIAAVLGRAPFRAPERIVRVDVSLQSGVLEHLTLIDTPGLVGTAPDRQVATTIIGLAAGAEVVLHLFRGAARSDDAAVLDEVREGSGGPARGAATTIGLLSHADNVGSGGWGADDALALARESARRIAAALPHHFTAVLPVSGLMAESARTGRVTESDARALRTLRGLPREAVQFGSDGVDASVYGRLSALLTPYGLNHGREHTATSTELTEWLLVASGVRSLETALRCAAVRARHIRCARALDDLGHLVRRSGRSELERDVETFAHSPWGHVAKEVRAELLLSRDTPHSPFVGDLRTLLSHPTPGHRLSIIPAGVDGVHWAMAEAGRYQAESGAARSGAEREAARTLAQSMLQLSRLVSRA